MDLPIGTRQRSLTRIFIRALVLLSHGMLMLILLIALLHALLAAAPGDAIDTFTADEDLRTVLEAQWGLDAPIHQRILQTIYSLFALDLGFSWTVRPGQRVTTVLTQPTVHSLSLVCMAIFISLGTGFLSAWAQRSRLREWTLTGMLRSVSILPIFVVGISLIAIINAGTWYAMESGWIVRPTYFALPVEASWVPFCLAVFTLAFSSGSFNAIYHAFTETFQSLEQSKFILATRGQHRSPQAHYMRHFIHPFVSISTKRVPMMLGSLVIIDPVFNMNGLGRFLIQAADARDFPVLFGAILCVSLIVLGLRFLNQITEYVVDPRLRVHP